MYIPNTKFLLLTEDKTTDPVLPKDDAPVSTPQKITREEIKKFDENTRDLSDLKEMVEKARDAEHKEDN